ncbi:hypothetical protein ACQCVP_19485 [Rossellomorea vietnamensis]
MKTLASLRRYWHNFMVGYNKTILEGCLDKDLRTKIRSKIEYHRLKVIGD